MHSLFLVLSTKCKEECPHCFYNVEPSRKYNEDLDVENLIRIFSNLRERNIEFYYLTGGEPLDHPDIFNLVRSITNIGAAPILLTNIHRPSESDLENLVNSGLAAMVVSLGRLTSAPILNRIEAELDSIVQRKAMLAKYFPDSISSILVITAFLAPYLSKILQRLKSIGLDTVIQPAFVPHTLRKDSMVSPFDISNEEWTVLMEEISNYSADTGLTYYPDYWNYLRDASGNAPKICRMGSDSAVIQPDGSIHACFHRPDLSAGNILHHDVDDVFNIMSGLAKRCHDARCFGDHCISMFLE